MRAHRVSELPSGCCGVATLGARLNVGGPITHAIDVAPTCKNLRVAQGCRGASKRRGSEPRHEGQGCLRKGAAGKGCPRKHARDQGFCVLTATQDGWASRDTPQQQHNGVHEAQAEEHRLQTAV